MDQTLQGPTGGAPVDWRGLLSNLVRSLDERAWGITSPPSWAEVKAARAALAEPEREVVEPSLEEVEDLCEEHCFNVEGYESIECLQGLINDALARWHRPAPAPAEGEVAELVAWLRGSNWNSKRQTLATRAADLLERQATACAICERERLHQSTRAADLEVERQAAPVPVAIPGEEYHEDMGAVTWWRLPVDEPPWVGTPNDSDWPGYHTHFTPAPPEPAHALPLPAGEVEE